MTASSVTGIGHGAVNVFDVPFKEFENIYAEILALKTRLDALEEGTGGATALAYSYRLTLNSTSVPPSQGRILFDNTTYASATKMYIHETDDNNINRGILLNAARSGDQILLSKKDDASVNALFTLSGVPTDQGDYVEFPLLTPLVSAELFTHNNRATAIQLWIA